MTDLDWERLARARLQPVWVAVLQALAAGSSMSPKQLSEALDEPLGNISYHVRRLARHDLVALVGTAPRRGAVEHFYALSPVTAGGPQPIEWERVARAAIHPIAIGVLLELSAPETASPIDLARRFGIPVGRVSYHVRELAASGLVTLVRTRQRRGATQHFYAVSPWLRRDGRAAGRDPAGAVAAALA
jgi:DNA-binding transcriptional ArsR family regulator